MHHHTIDSIAGDTYVTSIRISINPAHCQLWNMHAAMATPAEVYKKGFLYKRQRGRRSKDLQKLKFQGRFCQLTTTAFEYYKGRRTVITHRLSNPGFAFDSSRYLLYSRDAKSGRQNAWVRG